MPVQLGITIFRVIQMMQDKTQFEENGEILFKDYNAVLDHLNHSLRASCEAFVYVVESLGNGQPLPASLA